MLHLLSDTPSVANQYVAQLRDVNVQADSMRFRRNMERLGECIGYELSKELNYVEYSIETPLGQAPTELPAEELVLATILRAGLPLHQGLLNVFDDAGNAFVSAYRKHHKDGTFEIEVEYLSCPDLENKVLIVCDPMLATGASMVLATQALLAYGKPSAIHFVVAIGARLGLEHLQRNFPDAHIWLAALDEELTAKSYIVPGLGDAGDLSYGAKLQD
ncbi:uracil phosphoribosyltransferase [Lewinella cohaerens]|uniref:uracil phosphoribosyltransferase n=1 Tax=Lewinella cohaerens TaxID=70995 RepID=UPI00037231EC|nr:uracil phosphoribosyltransferase [Lewinella cohaerens]